MINKATVEQTFESVMLESVAKRRDIVTNVVTTMKELVTAAKNDDNVLESIEFQFIF